MQSPFIATARTGIAGNVMRSARVVALAATFVLLAFSSAAAQPLTDSHRGRDLPAGHVSYSSWDIVKEGHRYRFLHANGLIKADAAPAFERRLRVYW
jgi:hypothetical protein